MLSIVGTPITFAAFFTSSKQGKSGIGVTCDVYGPDLSPIVQAQAATEIAGGLYQYELAAESVTDPGNYMAIFKTADATVDVQHVPAMIIAVGHLPAEDEEPIDPLDDSLAGLLWLLRAKLHDLPNGNYTRNELVACINISYRETCVRARCHKDREEINFLEATNTYKGTKVFEPVQISIDGSMLVKKELADMGTLLEAWDTEAPAQPTTHLQLSGDTFRVHPAPDKAYTGVLIGYAWPDKLILDTDRPLAVPTAHRISAILDRAEEEARRWRPTTANNIGLLNGLHDRWIFWCNEINASIKGVK